MKFFPSSTLILTIICVIHFYSFEISAQKRISIDNNKTQMINSLLGDQSVQSVSDEETFSIWAQAGYGVVFTKFSESGGGLNLSASLNFESKNNILSIGFTKTVELSLFTNPTEYINSYELKYGRSHDFSMRGLIFPFPMLLLLKKDFAYKVIGRIGVSYNEGLSRTNLIYHEFFNTSYNSQKHSGWGIPIEIELRENITDFLGLGMSVFGNFNSVNNYSGFNFHLYAGKF